MEVIGKKYFIIFKVGTMSKLFDNPKNNIAF
jgi:hypothetical protein